MGFIIMFSPDVRAFLQMDNPKHQSDPSEDEDERNSQKVSDLAASSARRITVLCF